MIQAFRKVENIFTKLDQGMENIWESRSEISNQVNKILGRLDNFVENILDDNEDSVSPDSRAELKYINDALSLSNLTLVFAAGSLVYYPLAIINLGPLCLLLFPWVKTSVRSLWENKKIDGNLIDIIFLSTALVGGYTRILPIFVWLNCVRFKIVFKTRDNAEKKIFSILGTQPNKVNILTQNVELQIPFKDLQQNDVLIVQAGEMIPIDGTIEEGFALIDQHVLTGESQPTEKKRGDGVFASTLMLSGKIYVKVEKKGDEVVAAKITKLLGDTLRCDTELQTRGELITDKSAVPTLIFAGVSLTMISYEAMLMVLASAFGYHMRFFGPISLMNHTNLSLQNGILIKDGRSLEKLDTIDTIVFDKTGTLTLEKPEIDKIYSFNGYSEEILLTYAAAAERKQAHPIAQAIIHEAQMRKLTLPDIDNAHYELGYGIKVKIDDKSIHVGSLRFMQMEKIAIDESIQAKINGFTVLVAVDKKIAGAIELKTVLRTESKKVVEEIKKRGITTYIISGDHEEPTRKIAQELGIDYYFAETLPQDKSKIVAEIQKQGKKVCFVGDGINDAVALKQADISVSLQGATSVAVDTAQIILVDQNLERVHTMLDIAHDFEKHQKNCFYLSMVPGTITFGLLLLGYVSIVVPIIANNAVVIGGISYSMLPIIRNKNYSGTDKLQS